MLSENTSDLSVLLMTSLAPFGNIPVQPVTC